MPKKKKKVTRKMSEEHKQKIAETQRRKAAERKASRGGMTEMEVLREENARLRAAIGSGAVTASPPPQFVNEKQTMTFGPPTIQAPQGIVHNVPQPSPPAPEPQITSHDQADPRGTMGFVGTGVHAIHSGVQNVRKNAALTRVCR